MCPAPRPIPAPEHRPTRPHAGVVSNGDYWVLVDAAGRGGSSWTTLQLTGGRSQDQGLRIYVRDRRTGRWWSVGERRLHGAGPGPRPELQAQPRLEIAAGQLCLSQTSDGITLTMELWVDPTLPVEVRTISIRNELERPRSMELTTFAEIVLHDRAAHRAHPVFSKLFLQTERTTTPDALLVQRRPRGSGERFPWLVHALLDAPVAEFETDRARFLGRGHSLEQPWAMRRRARLAGGEGNVLDPALSLRTMLDLRPGEERTFSILLGVGPDREQALSHVEALSGLKQRAASRAGAVAQEKERYAGLGLQEVAPLQALVAALLAEDPSLRADPEALARASGSWADLDRFGLSTPTPLVFLDAHRHPRAVPAMLRALSYCRALGLPIQWAVAGPSDPPASLAAAAGDDLRMLPELDAATRDRLAARAAWLVRDGGEPRLALPRQVAPEEDAAIAAPTTLPDEAALSDPSGAQSSLLFANEHGGFAPDGEEYVIHLRRLADGSWSRPPQPWINVIANERVGTLWSEAGAGSTWSRNSREHRLTPWSNDAVLDPHAEALHLRDDETGRYWSAWPGPSPGGDIYEMRHGFGSSRCFHRSHGLAQETLLFVPPADPVRCVVLRLQNLENRPRRLSVFGHCRLVLGSDTEISRRTVVTEFDAAHDLLLATNAMAGEFGQGIAFATAVTDLDEVLRNHGADEASYVGINGDLSAPEIVAKGLDVPARFGAGLEPCFTQQLSFVLAAGARATVCLLLGEVTERRALDALLARYASPAAIDAAFEHVRAQWREHLGAVQITTPSQALDLMVNGWLVYQTVACRLWARSAFYQSGGAYGFRDQLQDATALTALWPQLAREQILRHAAHQFVEGDVLHWWHPPHGRGLRTRFADDLLWLPHLTAHYLRTTGDRAVLEATAPYLRARPLADGEDEAFLQPEPSGTAGSLYEHCLRALDRSLTVGVHGLPLFGSGDWNDGMNRVGREGRGESVWMGFFLYTILGEWASLCEEHGDDARARRYHGHREHLRAALNDAGWDGQWYRRGFYDDGAPLGSQASDECQIDALAQAWSVLSGAAPRQRCEQAMAAVGERLIDEANGIVRLLTPPFENTPHDPGYIKGYVAGVRENGGQYTHAALWVVRAMAELDQRDTAMGLLDMLNPVHHARDDEHVHRYQVEPYVVAADVYGIQPHVGRGGWTWYTGSAGWMLRVALESVLGVRVEDGRWLVVDPRIPDRWPGFEVRFRPLGRSTTYAIAVTNPTRCAQGVVELQVDDRRLALCEGRARIELTDDGQLHRVDVRLGRTQSLEPAMHREGATE